MVPRKKRLAIIITIISIVVLMLITTFLILYFKTDIFKSNQYLFSKYMAGNINNVESILKLFDKNEYYNLLQDNKSTSNTQIKVNYTEGIGTSLENTQNDINNYTLNIEEKNDTDSDYNYKKIELLNNDENNMTIECIKNENQSGIKFSDIFTQYILVDNENIEKILEKIGQSNEDVEKLRQISLDNSIDNFIQLTETEKETVKNKYINIFNSNEYKDKFTRKLNVPLNIEGNQVTVNQYTLTLTKEQLNNIYIKMLEMLKEDEIVLAKLDSIAGYINNYDLVVEGQKNDIKEEYISYIDDLIEEINRNNIGNEDARIVVYEKNGNALRTTIDGVDYQINLDFSENHDHMKIAIDNTKKQKRNVFEIKNGGNNVSVNLEKSDIKSSEEEIERTSIEKEEKVNGDNCDTKISITKEKDNNKLEIKMEKTTEIVNDIEGKVELENESILKLDNLNEEEFSKAMEIINNNVSEKVKGIIESINKDNISNIKNIIGIKEAEEIQAEGISETEKSRFNTKIEMFKGEELEKEDILNLIDECKDYFVGMQVISNNELKLQIEVSGDAQVATQIEEKLQKYFEKSRNEKYKIDIAYNETTGLAEYIIIDIEKN